MEKLTRDGRGEEEIWWVREGEKEEKDRDREKRGEQER